MLDLNSGKKCKEPHFTPEAELFLHDNVTAHVHAIFSWRADVAAPFEHGRVGPHR